MSIRVVHSTAHLLWVSAGPTSRVLPLVVNGKNEIVARYEIPKRVSFLTFYIFEKTQSLYGNDVAYNILSKLTQYGFTFNKNSETWHKGELVEY